MPFTPFGIDPNLTPDSDGDPLRSAIVARILADTVISGIVGTKVSRNSIPQRNVYACIVVTKTNDIADRDLDGLNGTSIAGFSIAAVSTDSTQINPLRKALISLFDDFSGVLSSAVTVDEVIKTAEVDLPEPPQNSSDKWVYRTVLDFDFYYRS